MISGVPSQRVFLKWEQKDEKAYSHNFVFNDGTIQFIASMKAMLPELTYRAKNNDRYAQDYQAALDGVIAGI